MKRLPMHFLAHLDEVVGKEGAFVISDGEHGDKQSHHEKIIGHAVLSDRQPRGQPTPHGARLARRQIRQAPLSAGQRSVVSRSSRLSWWCRASAGALQNAQWLGNSTPDGVKCLATPLPPRPRID